MRTLSALGLGIYAVCRAWLDDAVRGMEHLEAWIYECLLRVDRFLSRLPELWMLFYMDVMWAESLIPAQVPVLRRDLGSVRPG